MESAIVIGGGAVGLSVAYHLAHRDAKNIVLLEKNQLASGTSWHAAGIVGPLRATPNMTQLAMYAGELFPELETVTGQTTGYRKTGGYWLARRRERMDELHRIAALGAHFGLSVDMFSAEDTQRALPFLNLRDHDGSLRVLEDATVNPVDLCAVYARAAKSRGVDIRENTSVSDIMTYEHRVLGVQLDNGTSIETDTVAICCGAWSKPLAQRAGLPLPLQAVEHMYVVSEALTGLPDPFPVIRDLDTGIYLKGDVGGKLILGGFEPNAKCWDPFGFNGNIPFLELAEDWDQFAPFMASAIDLCPALESAGIEHFMNGPESFTMDTKPLIGEAPDVDGLFVAAGMNSVGVMSSAGIGRVLADWMIDGKAPTDLWEVDVARADPKTAENEHIQSRMKEAVSDQFSMHWPFKQPNAGRNVRQSVLHNQWRQLGAVFGSTAHWERGLWYAMNGAEQSLPYSVGAQPWQSIAEREAQVMAEGAVLIDLTPFSKFDVKGSDARAFLDRIACSSMDMITGKITYTLLLNESGGIEADVTISCFAEDHFRITSGAATRWRDKALLRRSSAGFRIEITDVTEEETVVGVMGRGSRALLSSLVDGGLQRFDYSTTQPLSFSGNKIRASRISYVGELGWELYLPNHAARAVFASLVTAGAKPMGHYALESCRIEKGFRHWGHDMGPDLSPLQAGLGFTIDWDKEFVGKAALFVQRQYGVTARLCLFQLEGQPLMLHDEPIREAGKVVGLATSGTQGVRTGLTLAFGLIEVRAGEHLQETLQRDFTIEVADRRYPAMALGYAPFDPEGARMRS